MPTKSFTIARLFRDGHHVTTIGYDRFEAELASLLLRHGALAKLYGGRAEGSIRDLARQASRMRTETVVLTIDRYSAGAAKALAIEMLILRPNTAIVFFATSEDSIFAELELETIGIVAVVVDAYSAVEHLLEKPLERSVDCTESLYAAGILKQSDLDKVGIRLADSWVSEDIAWISCQSHAPDIIAVDARGVDDADIAASLADLLKVAAAVAVKLKVDTTQLSNSLAADLQDFPIASVQVVWFDGHDIAYPTIKAPLELIAEGRIPNSLQRAQIYMVNGVIANFTGLYVDPSLSPGISHLSVQLGMDKGSRREAYNWLGSSMAIKSAILVSGPRQLISDALSDFSDSAVVETGGWPNHVYAQSDQESGSLWFDGIMESAESIRRIAYADFVTSEPCILGPSIISITTTEDVDAITTRLEKFHAEGLIDVPIARQPVYFENSCRWLPFGACKLALLKRVQVRADNSVLACHDAGMIGVVGDSTDRLAVGVRQHQQLEEARRGCTTCPVRDECSRCTNLPDAWGGQYCSIRTANPATALFFELHLITRILRPHLPADSNNAVFYVSADQLPSRHFPQTDGTAARRRPVILTFGNMHFAWQRGTTKLVKLSGPLATMLEGHWLGAASDEIARQVSARFDVSHETAVQGVAAGLAKLEAGGLIHVHG